MEIGSVLYRVKKERSAYFFIMPIFLAIIVFTFVPLVLGVRLSFFQAGLREQVWVGFKNYSEMFQDPIFWLELKNTLIIASTLIPLSVGFSLLIAALILRFGPSLRSFFRGAFFLPGVVSGVVISMVWIWIFNPLYGLLNYMLGLVGIAPVIWLGETNPARFAVIILLFSWSLGGNVLLYSAALSAIPKTMYEAAVVDGANVLQRFFKITVPLVLPMTLYILMIASMGAFQVVEAVFVLTGGGPAYSTTTIAFRIYQLGFRYFRFGQASARGVILLIIIFSFSFVQFRYLSKKLEF